MERFVHLLGPPRVRVGDTVHAPPPTLASALGLYLASSDGWIARDEICAVFWGDSPQANARASLRQVLHRLRKTPYGDGIEAEAARLAWRVATDLGAHQTETSKPTDPATFLEGFQLPHAPGFEDWLERRRAQVLQDRRSRAHLHAQSAIDGGLAHEAVDVLAPWLTFDALDERTLQLYLTAAAKAGLDSEGMRRYEAFREALLAELGMAPAEETHALAAELGRRLPGDVGEKPDTANRPGSPGRRTPTIEKDRSLAHAPTRWPLELIGRTAERERIERWLGQPGAVGVYGAGGIGKTRLASECFRRRHESFPSSAWWIHLGDVGTAEEALARIAQGLDLGSTATAEPIDLLAARLGERDALLVLDNLEQIDDAVELLRPLLDRCKNLRVLFTSRVRLELPRTRAIELRGLPVDDGSPAHTHPSTAAEMFIAAVQRHGGDVDRERDLARVEAFCAAVRGMPLAVEHAAAWTRLMPVGPALDHWEADPRTQPPFPTDTDPRHVSIDQVFETSWHRLSVAARNALRRLQVFRDGCSLHTALEVAGVGIPGIARLRDHAMVDIDGAGRVVQHPLLTHWLARTVQTDEALMERHARHFMSLLAEAEHDGQNVDPRAALRRILADLSNIEAAWAWALDHEAWDLFENTGPMLGFAWLERRRPIRWIEQLEDAATRIPEDHAAWPRVEVHVGSMAGHAGDARACYERCRRAREASRGHEDPHLLGWTSLLFGNAAIRMDRDQEALEAKRESLDQFRRTGQGGLIAMSLNHLYRIEPDRSAREHWYRELETLCAELQMPTLAAETSVPRAYGLVHDWGRYTEALALARSAVAAQREAAWNLPDLAISLVAEANVLNYMGNLDAAERRAREAIERTADIGSLHYFDPRTAIVEIARARRLRGDSTGAREALAEAPARHADVPTSMHLELAELALLRHDLASARAHADAAGAKLPKHPWSRPDVANTLEVRLVQAAIAAKEGAGEAEHLIGCVLEEAWSRRFIPLTLHALAHLLPHAKDPEQARFARFLARSMATPFETRLLLARQGLSEDISGSHATDRLDGRTQSDLEAALARSVAQFARA